METEKRIELFQVLWSDGRVRITFDDQYIEMSEKCARTLATAIATAADGAKVIGDNDHIRMRMEVPE